jgi:tRNA U34 5-methylaminomethyl-2-thiouridine-forming methyltransferase MnmC
MTFKSPFEIVKTTMGATSIKDNGTGEILHNPVGPWEESRALYVKQSNLEERLLESRPEPLVLYDVGLGAAFNVVAALEVFYKLKASGRSFRDLQIMSFETDLTLLDFFLSEIQSFPESTPYENQLRTLREKEVYTEDKLHWELHGSFSDISKFELPKAEVVFFDPYSPKKNPDMWTVAAFQLVQKNMSHELPACVLTYSTATPIRTAMLLSGLFVGQGQSSGFKEETTFGATTFEGLKIPLGARWLERWQRSHTAMPLGDHKFTIDGILEQLKAHPQFSNQRLLQNS